MTNSAQLARTAGAVGLTVGMSIFPTNTKVMAPLFMSSWAALAYGLTDGFEEPDPWILGGTAAIVLGGMGARMTKDKKLEKLAEATFMAGWLALAEGLGQQGASRALSYGSAAAVVGGASLIRAREMGGKKKIPEGIGPAVFALGWVGILSAASTAEKARAQKQLPA